jgi:serine O-acetyltransferase
MNAPHTDKKPTHRIGLLSMMREDVLCVFDRDPAARYVWEVLSTYPGVHALLVHRLSHKLWRLKLRYLARLMSAISRLFTGVDIHPGAQIGRRFFIDHGMGVVIGETAEIGNDCTLYHGVTLGGTSWNPGKRHPTLRDRVMVGAGAKILGPVTIGHDTQIGANAVVISDVSTGMTVVGIPGRVVLPPERRRISPHGIDLDHHLMPDPVGKAIQCLMDRISVLERQLQAPATDEPIIEADCEHCTDIDPNLCGTSVRDSAVQTH